MKNRILIIGAGAQGNVVSGVLGKAEDVGGITLGDIDLERAREVAAFVDPDKIEVIRIDASNVEEMTSLMKSGDYDLVVNATLTDFNRSVVQAAVNAKIHYLDMASHEYSLGAASEVGWGVFLARWNVLFVALAVLLLAGGAVRSVRIGRPGPEGWQHGVEGNVVRLVAGRDR